MPRSPEDQRAVKQTRYADYKQLCADRGVPQQRRWWPHYNELRGGPAPVPRRVPEPAVLERRLTAAELACWWTEHLSPSEIRELAGGIDLLEKEKAA